jgi:TetR/AcrR family transcriptional repressor of multidrug resistance operon
MRKRDVLKEELVKQKAMEIIVQHGLEGFTIPKLAKACGISVGTPYVYYKDKDDLIKRIVLEEGARMEESVNKDFDPKVSLEIGLRVQWQNRYAYMKKNALSIRFLDQVSRSSYRADFSDQFNNEQDPFLKKLKANMETFVEHAVQRGELDQMPFSVFWSLAFSPLYSLRRFHDDGYGIDQTPFVLDDKNLWMAFSKMIKGLRN